MNPQYSHDLITSVVLWLDNKLCGDGGAYDNITGGLFLEPVVAGQPFVYSSPYRAWVYDSCVAGAVIPSGFFNSSGQFLTRNSGISIDFINGKVISNTNLGSQISGVYSRKQMNIYYGSDKETNYILEQVYNQNKNINYNLTGINGKVLTAPLMMLTNARGENKPWALGGMDDSKNTIRMFIISDSNYLQEGVNSILQDSAHITIPFVPYSAMPFTFSGDLKTGGWSYCSNIYNTYGCSNGIYFENIYDYKMNEKQNQNFTFFLSAIEIDTSKPRVI